MQKNKGVLSHIQTGFKQGFPSRFKALFSHYPVGGLLTCKSRKTGFRGGWVDLERPKRPRQDPVFLVFDGVSTVFDTCGDPPLGGQKNTFFFTFFGFGKPTFLCSARFCKKTRFRGQKKCPRAY